MNENLIPECREFTMIEGLWPIKKYEGNRPVWDCRNWIVGAVQGEILEHVKRYSYPYVLTLSEEPIWTQVEYENRRDKRYTVGMQKLSPLEISMIVTPFFRKGYRIYQDEKSKCIKISRKEIPELNTLQIPPDIVQGPAGTSRLDQIWAKEERDTTGYMMELLRYRGFSAVKRIATITIDKVHGATMDYFETNIEVEHSMINIEGDITEDKERRVHRSPHIEDELLWISETLNPEEERDE